MSETSAPEVTTASGIVRGIRRPGSCAYLGIPFAAPPVGELRFAAPEPPEPWSGVREAIAHGATAQRRPLGEVTAIPEPSIPGESTLNVDVFTPRPGDTDARLPVLVWIHGGAFVGGSPASPWYDGAAFNRDGVVTVTISYRLGFIGFGEVEGAVSNRGVLDWIAALEWVRANIAAFGGDPDDVTIAGQSAGGGAVLALLAAPRARGLFRRAMSLSGVAPDLSLADARAHGRALAAAAGVPATLAGVGGLSEERILDLQDAVAAAGGQAEDGEAADGQTSDAQSADGGATGRNPEVAGGATGASDPFAPLRTLRDGGLYWAPVIDGDVLPEPVQQALATGASADVPLVLSTTDHEFNLATAPFAELLDSLEPDRMLAALGTVGLPPEVATAYLRAHARLSNAEAVGQLATDLLFRSPALRIAEGRMRSAAPTWLARFAWRSPVSGQATHCLDVPFFFDCLDDPYVVNSAGPKPPQELARDVHAAAVAFITGSEPGWPVYAEPERAVRVFDAPSHVAPDGYADVASLG